MAHLSRNINVLKHHEKKKLCSLRPQYRRGRKDTAVKVYNISQESAYLMFKGIPSVGVKDDLRLKCEEFGQVDDLFILDEYPNDEEFTDVYLVKFKSLMSSKACKKKLDDFSFYGGVLHVFYAPEFETINETHIKIQSRMRHVANVTGRGKESLRRFDRTPFINSDATTSENYGSQNPEQSTYVWAGKTFSYNPHQDFNQVQKFDNTKVEWSDPNLPSKQELKTKTKSSSVFLPRQLGVKRKLLTTSSTESSSNNCSHSTDASVLITETNIRNVVTAVGVSNPSISFKKKKLKSE